MEELSSGSGNGHNRLNNGSSLPPNPADANSINSRTSYSIPGILHFVQHEWARFEMERAHWEVERAELQARIAFLQGERKGQENLKRDMVRRIKMLEFALRQERQKLHKLKHGTSLKLPEPKEETENEEMGGNELLVNNSHDLVFNYRQGRQLLRQYLQEIGYTDKVLDMRSARIRSLLGVTTDDLPSDSNEHLSERSKKKLENRHEVALNESGVKTTNNESFHRANADGANEVDGHGETSRVIIKSREQPSGENDLGEKEDEALKNFDFLGSEDVSTIGQDHNENTEESDDWGSIDSSKLQQRIKQFKNETKDRAKKSKRPTKDALKNMLQTFNTEEDISPPQGQQQAISNQKNSDGLIEEGHPGEVALPSPGFSQRQMKGNLTNHSGVSPDSAEVALGLGELAGLTITNEASPLSDNSGRDDIRKTWGPKYTLRNHFDGVRSICFHPYESALVTASEDHTLKLWSLQKNLQGKKGNISDLEPVYTFRGHSGPVLCCVINSNASFCYSGGVDSTIQCWNLPSLNIELFGPYDPNLKGDTLVAHTDAVWDLAYHIDTDHLLSCSSDGTCKLWNPSLKTPLKESYTIEDAIPTSVSFINTDTGQMAASYNNESCVLFDIESAKAVTTFTPEKSYGNSAASQINKVVSHPTYPMVITAHEDRHIRFFDINSGKEVHSMVAHLDAVTSLSIDPSGLYVLSGSHDGSIRLWSMDNKTCIQEITAHRKKFDEAVFDVAFHPSQPYIASAGADALAKVFV